LNITAHGILHDPAILGIIHKTAYATVSDHAPVYIVLDHAKVNMIPVKGQPTVRQTQLTTTCIDINKANQDRLDRLDHVGPVTARRIVQHRLFRSLGGLTAVSGLSRGYVVDIRHSGQMCPIK